MRRSLPKNGFTLVELLVALGLTIFLLALFTTLMVAATGSINTSQGIGAADQQVRNAIMSLRDDLNSVYVAKNGTRLSLSKLFTGEDKIPTQGYFMLEENDRALRQGLDSSGLPVEIDTDDVLAFTVGHPAATSSEEFYSGAVFNDPSVTNNPSNANYPQDFGEYLDNTHNSPATRFDAPGDSRFTSRFAEVVYFLRPTSRQYAVNDLRGDITNPTQIAATPATYTLYRRQLLVVENAEKLNRDPNNASALAREGFPLNATLLPNGRTFYDLYDLSASREFVQLPAGTQWTFTDNRGNNLPRLRLHTLEDLSHREFRYGMQLVEFPNPDTIAGGSVYRAFPLSHPRQPGLPHFVHWYFDDPTVAPAPTSPFLASTEPASWFGRPTQAESCHPDFPFWVAVNATNYNNSVVTPSTTPVQLLDTDKNAVLDPYETNLGQRAGDDVLLTNVVSFDVKVFDDFELPGNVPPVTDAVVKALLPNGSPFATNPFADLDLSTMPGWGTAPMVPIVDTVRDRRSEFVDLGFDYDDRASPWTSVPGNDIACTSQRLSTYFYSPTGSNFGLPFKPTIKLAHSPNPNPVVDKMNYWFGPDGSLGGGDDFTSATLSDVRVAVVGSPPPNDVAGRLGDDANAGIPGFADKDDPDEYMAPGSDDISPYFMVPFRLTGRVAATETVPGGPDDRTQDFNLGWLNPRNTYDTWSAAQLPGRQNYEADHLVRPAMGTTRPNGNFRPVPYPRPLRGIQIKLRVLEPKSGIVREFTLRHFFDEK